VPATTTAPQQQKPPPQPPPKPTQAQLIAAILAALAVAVTAAGVAAALGTLFLAAGIRRPALKAVAALMLSWPQGALEGTGPAQRWAIRTNALRRAQYFLSACRRVQAAADGARAHNDHIGAAIAKALKAEWRFQAQQVSASQQRVTATSAVDGMAATYGNLLGWNAVIDPRCTPECKAADRKNFHADKPPAIGYPGTTHPNCRCFPSAPFEDAATLP
jgi:hypothetical protein